MTLGWCVKDLLAATLPPYVGLAIGFVIFFLLAFMGGVRL